MLIAAVIALFATQATAQARGPYRVAVVFGSACCGIDNRAFGQFRKILEEFERKHGVHLDYWEAKWGREGEFSICFELKEIPTHAQHEFVAALHPLTKNSARNLTSVEEYSRCHDGPIHRWERRPN